MNKLTSSTSALKGIGVSSNTLNFKEKGRILELTEQQETHYLDFNQYRQDLRIDTLLVMLKRTSIKFKE